MLFSLFRSAGLLACVLTLFSWIPPVLAKENTSERKFILQLAAVVERTLASSPDIEASQAAIEAAQANLAGAGLPLNNPELEVEAERTDISTYTLGFSQTVDWHDKQRAFKQSAQAELAAVQANADALRLSKASEILDTISKIAALDEINRLSKQRTEILNRFAKLAKQRHEAGDIARAELALAQLSLAEAVMQQTGNGAELIQARSRFLSISGQQQVTQINFPDQIPAIQPDSRDVEQFAKNHPQVQAAHQQALSVRQQMQTADLVRKADPTIGLAAGREDEENLIALSFSIPLQVRNDFRSSVDAAQAEALKAEQEAQQAYQNLLAELNGAKESYQLVARTWEFWLAQGRPSLQQSTQLLETQWRAGEMSTADYLLQIQQMLDTQIAGVELQGNLWKAWFEWLNASGTLITWLNQTTEVVPDSLGDKSNNGKEQ
ncbi:MAG: TolC family protein [Candidatus Thiodiazotropha sp. (ex Monitilora ramsayi)]|nr:TolC family protein [Candidatus Thiodiazotropha sp. (ex Monitilora ramsayi)]